jgi:subtilisin family serine protease
LLLSAPAWPQPGSPSAQLLGKLDVRLLAALQAAPDTPQPVWVEFADKGEAGPGDLVRRLAEAEAGLTERARARRIRAGARPLVDYRDLPVSAEYVEALRSAGFQPYGASRWFNRVAVRATPANWEGLAALTFVARLAPVELVLPSRDPTPSAEPLRGPAPPAGARGVGANPADYGLTWDQLEQVQLPALHDSGSIGTGVLICMLDDGFYGYRSHEALKLIPVPVGHVRNFLDGDYDVEDTRDEGIYALHGAHTLGVAGGRKTGIYRGAAYGATFALARTEYDPTETPVEMVYWGMGAEWADSLGADIISSSLGYNRFDSPYPSYTYDDMDGRTTTVTLAAIVAAEKGILVVTAAGNEGASPWHYIIAPGDVSGDSALTVGAVNSTGGLASFSSRGPTADGRIKPDVVARGVAVVVPHVYVGPTDYSTADGTSFSTPIVAGLAACLLQAHPAWTPVQLSQAIRLTADRATTPDNDYGYGLVRAVDAAGYPVAVTPPPTPTGRLTLRARNPFRMGIENAAFEFAPRADQAGAGAAVRVVDLQGRRVRSLWSGSLEGGRAYRMEWDGRDDDGRLVPSGVYFVRLDSPRAAATLRLVALR